MIRVPNDIAVQSHLGQHPANMNERRTQLLCIRQPTIDKKTNLNENNCREILVTQSDTRGHVKNNAQSVMEDEGLLHDSVRQKHIQRVAKLKYKEPCDVRSQSGIISTKGERIHTLKEIGGAVNNVGVGETLSQRLWLMNETK